MRPKEGLPHRKSSTKDSDTTFLRSEMREEGPLPGSPTDRPSGWASSAYSEKSTGLHSFHRSQTEDRAFHEHLRSGQIRAISAENHIPGRPRAGDAGRLHLWTSRVPKFLGGQVQ